MRHLFTFGLATEIKALKTLNQLLNELYTQGESYYLTDTIGGVFHGIVF